jgi:hypothetical protein
MGDIPTEPGTYVNDHHGIYAPTMVAQLAAAWGYKDKHLSEEELTNLPTDYEHWNDVLDDIDSWLNDQMKAYDPPQEYYWGWWEGSFGLWPIEDDNDL